MRSFSRRIAFLCLLLTLFSAVAFVAHHHLNASDAAKCTICITAHSASPRVAAVLPNHTFVQTSISQSGSVSAKQRLVAFALRRPPASCSLEISKS